MDRWKDRWKDGWTDPILWDPSGQGWVLIKYLEK